MTTLTTTSIKCCQNVVKTEISGAERLPINFCKSRKTQNLPAFAASSTLTATATVAPTIGLLPNIIICIQEYLEIAIYSLNTRYSVFYRILLYLMYFNCIVVIVVKMLSSYSFYISCYFLFLISLPRFNKLSNFVFCEAVPLQFLIPLRLATFFLLLLLELIPNDFSASTSDFDLPLYFG